MHDIHPTCASASTIVYSAHSIILGPDQALQSTARQQQPWGKPYMTLLNLMNELRMTA